VVGLGSIIAGLAGAIVLGGILRRLWRRGHSKTAFLQITGGVVWLIAWALFDGITLVTGAEPGPFSARTMAAVVASVWLADFAWRLISQRASAV
jgi:hypothetical protein